MSNPNATTELAHYWRAQLIEELTALPLQFSSVRVVESHIQFCTGTRTHYLIATYDCSTWLWFEYPLPAERYS